MQKWRFDSELVAKESSGENCDNVISMGVQWAHTHNSAEEEAEMDSGINRERERERLREKEISSVAERS